VPVCDRTGDWFETITFKLRAAGIPFEDIPMVTSSDFYSRRILSRSRREGRRQLHEAVYIGDGLWDFRALPKARHTFSGGQRKEKLQSAGAAFTIGGLKSGCVLANGGNDSKAELTTCRKRQLAKGCCKKYFCSKRTTGEAG